jgi:hypothetical protein
MGQPGGGVLGEHAVQHSIVARSSQWMRVMPPASARLMTRVNSLVKSNDGRHEDLHACCPAATASASRR